MEMDALDLILKQWSTQRPDLDVSPMGVCGRIAKAAKILDRSYAETFREFGINGGEFDVLAALRRSGSPFSLTPTQLYQTMMLSSGAMTNRIDRLEERGFVVREADTEDRRSQRITLTPEGRSLVDRAVEAHLDSEEQVLSSLDAEERELLASLLRKLLLSLEDSELTQPRSRNPRGSV